MQPLLAEDLRPVEVERCWRRSRRGCYYMCELKARVSARRSIFAPPWPRPSQVSVRGRRRPGLGLMAGRLGRPCTILVTAVPVLRLLSWAVRALGPGGLLCWQDRELCLLTSPSE
jgi:hypothetical protein